MTVTTEVERELLTLVIGHTIRSSRKQLGLSQEDLAQGVCSQSMISLFENGQQLPMPDVLELIAQKLNKQSLLRFLPLLTSKPVTLEDLSIADTDVLFDALRSQRGKWQDVHERVALQLGRLHYTAGLFAELHEICRLIMKNTNEPQIHAEACFLLGSSYLHSNDYDEAQQWLKESEHYHHIIDAELLGKTYYNLGYMYTQTEVHGLALWYAQQSVNIFHQLHDIDRHAKALTLLGVIQSRLRRPEEAKQSLEMAYQILSRWNPSPVDTCRIETNIADVYIDLKEYRKAEEWCVRAIHSAEMTTEYMSLCMAYGNYAIIKQHLGESTKAVESIGLAIQYANQSGDSLAAAKISLLAVGLYTDYDAKLEAAEDVYRLSDEAGHHNLKAIAAECLSRLHMEQGRDMQSAKYQRIALQAYRAHAHANHNYKDYIQFINLD